MFTKGLSKAPSKVTRDTHATVDSASPIKCAGRESRTPGELLNNEVLLETARDGSPAASLFWNIQ